MLLSRILVPSVFFVSLAGCMQTADPMVSSRGASLAQISATTAQSEQQMTAQADALTQMTRDIIRKSTAQGVAIGAIAGCGLAVISASNAKSCVGAAVAGGAIGAVAGHANGKAQATKRIELVSPSALVRSIGRADDQMEAVTRDLPQLLAAQNDELNKLNLMMANGELTEAQYAQRFDLIKANRAQLAEALSLSATQASEAHRNLQAAQAQGQTGLDWHLHATKQLAREATSARSSISLL